MTRLVRPLVATLAAYGALILFGVARALHNFATRESETE